MEGCYNDINVSHHSTKLATGGHAPEVTYEINGHSYNKQYYLADDIYPNG
jgi:hypothetical protein